MPVPTIITDLSTTESVNFPQDSDITGSTVASLPRNLSAIIKKQFVRGTDITVTGNGLLTIPVENNYFLVTGTGFNITGFTDNYNGRSVTLRFSSSLTLVHSLSFFLPTGANIVVAPDDIASFVNDSTGVWVCISYDRAILNKLGTYAPLASPVFTGNPTAPTPATTDNDTSLATTAFVKSAIATTGKVIQIISATDPGNSTNSISYVGLNISPVSITPKSTNSKLLIECSLSTSIGPLSGVNTSASFSLNEFGVGNIGNEYPVSAQSFEGGIALYTISSIRFVLNNTSLSTRIFTVSGKTSNTSALAGGVLMVWSITEIGA